MQTLPSSNKTTLPQKVFIKRLKLLINHVYKQRQLFMILIIPLLLYIFFAYVPMLKVKWAFTNIGEVAPSKVSYIGFANFEKLFKTSGFLNAFFNTLIISFMKLLFGFPAPIIVAIFLNEINKPFYKKTVQTILYFPNFLSWVVIGSIWFMILSPQLSINAQLAQLTNSEPTYWFAGKQYIRWILVLSDIWAGAGYSAIVYLASMTSIDPGLYEAAVIDGAGKFRQIWHITLTGIRPTIIIMLIFQLGKILNIFDQVLVMALPMVYEKADVIQTYAYRIGIQEMKLGFGMAVSLFKAVFSFILVLVTNKLAKSFGEEGVF